MVRRHPVSWLAAAALCACKPTPDNRVSDERVADERVAKEPVPDERTPEERISDARHADARRICAREMAFFDPRAPTPLGPCHNDIVAAPDLYRLDDAGYAAYIRCRDAARSMDESLACTREAEDGKWTPKTDAELAMDREYAAIGASEAERRRKLEDEQLARLDGLVAGGAIDASMIAELRAQRDSPPQRSPQGWPLKSRVWTIANDAVSLIEAGRIAPGHKLAIQLPPPADVQTRRPGSTGAELVFVDAKTSRVVARIAPTSKEEFRNRNGDIEELLKWAAEDPERRDLEFEIEMNSWESGADAPPPPDVFNKDNHQSMRFMKESGLAERRMIHVDGTPMTPGEWIKDPDPFVKGFGDSESSELVEQAGTNLVGKRRLRR